MYNNVELDDIINRRTEKNGECIEWIGHVDKKGLPRMCLKRKSYCVHRYTWEKSNPKVLGTEYISRSCKNDKCINIEHLRCNPKKKPIIWSRVWTRLLKHTKRDEDGCILWTGAMYRKYGQSSLCGVPMHAHRVSYMVKTKTRIIPGEIDGEKTNIRHMCNKPTCIEPTHLEIGTLSQNNFQDKIANKTLRRGEKHYAASITKEVASDIKLSKRKRGDSDYVSQRSRSGRFNVSLDLVKSIDCGKSWAHLPDKDGKTGSLRAKKAVILRKNAKNRVWTQDQFEKASVKLYSDVVKTSKNKRGDIEGDCWEMQSKVYQTYTRTPMFGKLIPSHVLSCEIKNGRHVTPGEVCRHLCGNPVCVNPHHLKFGTATENAVDALLHGSKACKLDPDKVREIRSNTTCTQEELSKQYGVSVGTIGSVQNNRTWKHVGIPVAKEQDVCVELAKQ